MNGRLIQLLRNNRLTSARTKLARAEGFEQAVLETENERDFYYSKLQNVEKMLQIHQEMGEESNPDHLIDKIFKVLYATAEETLTVNDEGEIVQGEEDDELSH